MNGLRFVLIGIALAGLLWNVANVLEAWRYERRPFVLRIRFTRNQSANHASKVQPCQILKFSTRK